MADAFAPKVQSSIAVEQPVQMPSILGGLADLGASIVKSSASAKGPSATQVKSAALQPFASRLEDLHGSNLEQGEFVKIARKMGRTQLSNTPEYEGDIMGILSAYGVTPEVTATTEADAFNAGLNSWLETPEGVNAIVRSSQFTADGTLDPEATAANVRSSFFDYLSEQTAIEESNRELKLAENDVKTHKALSDSKLQEFMPKWMEQSQATVDGIIASAVAGDARFDSPEEQLLALRQARADALNMYRGKASAAGIHSDVYSEKINEVVKPFDDLIKLAEDVRVDNQSVFTAYENAKKMGMDKLLIENFGAWGPHPAFAEEVMRQLASTAIASNEAAMKDFLLGSKEFSTEGFMDGLQFIPGVPASTKSAVDTPSTAVLNPEVLKTYRDGAAADDKYLPRKVDTAIQLLNGVEDAGKEQESIFRSLGSIYAASSVDDRPLGMAYLQQIFNPSAIRNITTASGTGGIGVDIKNTVASFSADQIRRQVGVISALTRDNQALSVVEQNGRLVVLRDGRVLPEAVKETGTVKDLFEAVNAVNFINQSVSRLEGVAEETVPLTGNLMGIQPDANIDELREFLDQPVTGGDGTDDLEGGAGTDVIVSNGPIAQRLGIDFGSYEQQYNLPSGYLERMAMIESSGNPNARAGSSSAEGLFQFIDSTAKQYGLKDKFDPVASTDAAARLASDNARVLKKSLGREPQAWELYLAHQQGAGGASKLLSNPSAKAVDIVGREAVVNNGGHADMTAGEFVRIWANKYTENKGGPTTFHEATGKPNPNVRPEPRPEPTGVSAPQTPQGGAVATSPRPQARPEGGTTREAPKGSQRASEVATEQQLQALVDNQFNTDEVFSFTSEADLMSALKSGEISPGDAVMFNGELLVIGESVDD